VPSVNAEREDIDSVSQLAVISELFFDAPLINAEMQLT
jgi:hypothetical protein